MTIILKPIAASLGTTNSILDLCLGDIDDRDAKKRVRMGEGPSIAWQVGHMLDHRCKLLGLLGVANESPYATKYTSTPASDGSDYPPKADFQSQWGHVFAQLETAMEAATPESLDRIVGHGAHGAKTVLDSIIFLIWHEAYHMGVVGSIRKELGYTGPAEVATSRGTG